MFSVSEFAPLVAHGSRKPGAHRRSWLWIEESRGDRPWPLDCA